MNDTTVPQTVLFPDLLDKPLVATFDQAHASSDGGAILLKAADHAVGLTTALASVLDDARAAARVTHAWADILRQRIFGIACGYADANDPDGLADGPIQKLLLESGSNHGWALGIAACATTISLASSCRRCGQEGTRVA